MPNFPGQPYNLHIALDKQFAIWKKDGNCVRIILRYAVKPYPEAFIEHDGTSPLQLQLPKAVNAPYKDWHDWFQNYLAPQVRIAAEAHKLPVYLKNNKNQIFLLEAPDL